MALDLKKVASVPHHELMIADVDNILIVVPEEGFKDTGETSRVTVEALRDYAAKLGKKCGLAIIENNIISQDPEARRNYGEGVTSDLFFGVTLVVSNPLARTIGNIAMKLAKMEIPTCMTESVESGVAWLKLQQK
jgi:hypothetical protein